MIFSQTCKAAIKAVIFITTRSMKKQTATIKTIVSEIGENEHTVAKLLQVLAKHQLISSIKGPAGGFFMTEAQMQARIKDVVFAIDGNEDLKRCVLGLNQCNPNKPCPIHFEYLEAKKVILDILHDHSIAGWAEMVDSGVSNLIN